MFINSIKLKVNLKKISTYKVKFFFFLTARDLNFMDDRSKIT